LKIDEKIKRKEKINELSRRVFDGNYAEI